MPSLRIGRAEIPYELRRSTTASERRITVTPGCVAVLALSTDDDAAINSFLRRKRQWVFNTVREMERITADRHAVPRFMTGSKIPFRGRRMRLTVRRSDGERIETTYLNGFIVDLPLWAGNDTDQLVASELKLWLKRRVRRDVMQIAAGYKARSGLSPRSIRVADFANGWGSCGPEGNILINWHLVFAPKKVLEYVVAHELAHLRHRSHGPAFWDFLRTVVPDFEASKAWLEANQGSLSAAFLDG
ncbi:SprT family zinc-dependent metalloprotease [Mesorhizobium sp. M0387]|uniref:M48 family metallopeptidase n=1 Tax=Mesorhizobium sp. M0387 TaxID=2956940 RepID=UPI00333BD194